MVKEQFRASVRGMKISHLTFGVPNAITMRKQAHIQCTSNKLYDFGDMTNPNIPAGSQASTAPGATPKPGKRPMPYGVLDPRLGTSQKGINCETCGLSLADCVGHLGFIDLTVPCFHPGFFKFIINILQTICKTCSRILLNPEDQKKFFLKLKKRNLTYLEKKGLHKAIVERAKKLKSCPHCGTFNGVVRKVALFKVAYQFEAIPTRSRKAIEEELKASVLEEYIDAIENNHELEQYIKKTKMELLNPLRVREIFKKIPDDDLIYLLIKDYRPEDLILTRMVVPPACIRPSVVNEFESGSNEDDLSVKLNEIILVNNIIKDRCQGGSQIHMILEDWDFLQLQIALYFNSETSGIPFQQQPKKPMRSLVQRLKGKHGRFRGNLSGKRVDFSSRSVISPNPNLQIDEVGVPLYIAKTLTYPDRVTPANIEKIRQAIVNGPDVHPGANYVVEHQSGNKIFLKFGNRKQVAQRLSYGDIVERHLNDGDIVLFNRQPSLHKLSIMCHRAKVHPHRTYQFNECVCTPYNADFDGDEMNLHLLQTEEARAEAAVLMGTKNNIITPRNGEPLIAAIQDFITGGFLLTQKDTFFDRSHASQLISQIMGASDSGERINFPPPSILKPVALWTGKQIFSLILKPRKDDGAQINLKAKGKNYSGSGEDMDINDSYVIIRNSQLLCGSVDKSTLGSGSKNNIFYIILRDFTADEAGNAMWRLARVASWFLANRGFSLGIDDVTPTGGLLRRKRDLLHDGYGKVDEYIRSLRDGKLDPAPGMTAEETLESMILKELSQIRDSAGKSCLRELSKKNSALIMSLCGSKGSLINVSQMVACVGQQAIRGERVPDGFQTRTLPHFGHHDKSPLAKGFVENSFYSGLTPTEFFFHTMAGREGLLDTAVKTAETGYMQRRLIKALEDLVVHYDGSVRNSTGEVVQFIYGDDSLDPASMEANEQPVDLNRLFSHVLATSPSNASISSYTPLTTTQELKNHAEFIVSRWDSLVSDQFKQTVKRYVEEYCDKMDSFKVKYSQYFEKPKQPAKNTRKSKNAAPVMPEKVNPVNKMYNLDKVQLEKFLMECEAKYLRAKLEPGTAVGAVCAQSIGEPTTQMTLKTFHFAGVASMNITQGVPRIKELIDANRNIATPIIRAALMNPYDGEFARSVKMRIEKTTLGQISKYMDMVINDLHCYIMIWLDLERIKLLKLELNANMVIDAIEKKLKIPFGKVGMEDEERVFVKIEDPQEMNQIRESLEKVVVKGIPTVKRAAIRIETKDNKDMHYLLIEGTGLRDVLATYGVDPNRTYTNNVLEMRDVLGIEAARVSIIKEIKFTMESHGIGIDLRHLKLLADMMTYKGEVLGITRHGLAKMKESALMLASFEQTADHLFEAAYYGQEDPILGVSESIISGMPMKIGTGFFDILYKPTAPVQEGFPDEVQLFDNEELHVPFSYEIDPQFAPLTSIPELQETELIQEQFELQEAEQICE